MKKSLFLLFTLLTIASSVNAETSTIVTTLWESEKTFENYAAIEFDKSWFSTVNAGDKITMKITACGESDAKFAFKQKDNGWIELTDFSWVDVSSAYDYEYVVTATTAVELAAYGLAIQGNNITVTKVTLSHDESASELWSSTLALGDWKNFEDLRNDGKGDLADAKVGDDIRVTFTNATEGCQIYVCDAASYSEFDGGYFTPSASEDAQSVTFRIANATVLEAIQDRGIVVKGKYATLTKIELVTYDGSYDAVAVTIGSDGIATFSSGKHLSFADTDITPYYASSVETGKVRLTSSTTTWAWQGYMLVGDPGTYTIPVVAEANASYPSTNYLQQMVNGGTVDASTEGTFHYIFAKDKSGNIAFYKLITADHTLGAKKAYLKTTTDIAPTSGNARVAMVFDDDVATEVKTIEVSPRTAESYYDLQGRKVTNPVKGLYIVNGNKIVVK